MKRLKNNDDAGISQRESSEWGREKGNTVGLQQCIILSSFNIIHSFFLSGAAVVLSLPLLSSMHVVPGQLSGVEAIRNIIVSD